MNKKNAFEYLICCLIQWHREITGEPDAYQESFSRLSILKLLFFTAATPNEEHNESSPNLLDIFNNFSALPRGPVESTIYDYIKTNDLDYFDISYLQLRPKNSKTKIEDIQSQINADHLNDTECTNIRNAVTRLRGINEDMVTYQPFTLVDISHKWDCWQIAYNYATLMGVKSFSISKELIEKSDKFYYP